MADGLFAETGYFYVMPKVALRPLAELFCASVLKMLNNEGRLDDTLIKKILTWRHNSGIILALETILLISLGRSLYLNMRVWYWLSY